jgi:hypothetical protein
VLNFDVPDECGAAFETAHWAALVKATRFSAND